MKVLSGQVILYDADCPMCGLYTKAFVRAGLLGAEGRVPYQDAPAACAVLIDTRRAVNEIALVDLRSGTVTYGVQSLFTVLGAALPMLRPLFGFRPFAWAAEKAYRLVSYNRRVIMPLRAGTEGTGPSLHRGYRWLWILLAWLITAGILAHYSGHLVGLVPAGGFWREYAVCGGQLLWQGSLLLFLDRRKALDYLGNMMSVSFAGGLALAVLSGILSPAGVVAAPVYAAFFLLVAALMLLEHGRRCRLLGLPWTVSASWVLYRLVLLLFILN